LEFAELGANWKSIPLIFAVPAFVAMYVGEEVLFKLAGVFTT
jgi:hypothetical protein